MAFSDDPAVHCLPFGRSIIHRPTRESRGRAITPRRPPSQTESSPVTFPPSAPAPTAGSREDRSMEAVKQADPEIHRLLVAEAERQEHQLEMIASENFASRAVIEA